MLINQSEFTRGPPRWSGAGTHALGGKADGTGLFSMEKRWFWEDLIAAFPCLLGGYQEDGTGCLEQSMADKQETTDTN